MAKAFLGIIMLDTVFPRIKGDIGNPDSFDFPVRYEVVKGASPERIVIQADPELVQPIIAAGRKLVREGAWAVSTSCGFLALFHKTLSQALPVPVLTSSLLQVPRIFDTIGPDQAVGIITARKQSLTPAHLSAAGIRNLPVRIAGMDDAEEFTRVFIRGGQTMDRRACDTEMKKTAQHLIRSHPEIGAIVLECTNMPPYRETVHRATDRPVYDIHTLINGAWIKYKAEKGTD